MTSPDEPLGQREAIEALPMRWNGSPVHSHLIPDDFDLVSRKEVLAALAVTRPEPDLDAAVEAVKALQGLDGQVTREHPSLTGPREPFLMPPAVITVQNGAGALVVRDEVLGILARLRSTKPG